MKPPPKPASRDSDAPGLPAREAALILLLTGLDHRGGFDEAMTRAPFTTIAPRDRAWARGLAATAFRRLGPIDAALQGRLKRAPPERVVGILRLGLAQLLFRDTPAFAAVATSVELADADRRSRPFKGLVNAILRGVDRERPTEPEAPAHVPPWLYARWSAAYGVARAHAIAAAVPLEAATDLSPRDPTEAPCLAEALEAEILPGGSLRTPRRGELSEWPGFSEGAWWVQDAAAAIPARLLDVKPGETALDLCAAPGGKTLQLAAAGARVTSLDRSEARMRRVTQNLERMKLEAETVVADASDWVDARQYDAVLLDAPCTATGTFRRHPDVLWAVRPAEVPKLAALQKRLLDSAADRVRPGGRLVYCVCSLEPEEGEAQVRAFLGRRPDFALAPAEPGEGGAPAHSLKDGMIRITPADGMDGFFIARLTRS